MTTASPLSPREAEVFQLVVAGRSDREIADALHIAKTTVRGTMGRILEKIANPLNLSPRAAMVYAAKHQSTA